MTEQSDDKKLWILYDIEDLLVECLATLDNYSDVVDGDNGKVFPNKAMSCYGKVSDMLDRLRTEVL